MQDLFDGSNPCFHKQNFRSTTQNVQMKITLMMHKFYAKTINGAQLSNWGRYKSFNKVTVCKMCSGGGIWSQSPELDLWPTKMMNAQENRGEDKI